MATFTDTFSISATLNDGRTLSMKQTTTYTVTKVYDSTRDRGDDAVYGFTSSNTPRLDAEPVFLLLQYYGNGDGTVTLNNTGADAATFILGHERSVQLHGTAIFDTDASAVTATVTEELDEVDISTSAMGGSVRMIALM